MKPNIRRLNKLLKHMEKENLSVDRFDFSVYRGYSPNCGTSGCMAGELPAIYPGYWSWHTYIYNKANPKLVLKCPDYRPSKSITELLSVFFNIPQSAAEHLFVPNCQMPDIYGGSDLSLEASKEQVTENLRQFIKWAKNAENHE